MLKIVKTIELIIIIESITSKNLSDMKSTCILNRLSNTLLDTKSNTKATSEQIVERNRVSK